MGLATGMPSAFFIPDGDRFVATELTGGPWDPRLQHGGPPAALLAGAMARLCSAGPLARLEVCLDRPVPVGPVRLDARVARRGRTVSHLQAELIAEERVVMRATALAVHCRNDAIASAPPLSSWPTPLSLPPFAFPFFRQEVGYHRAVDVRLAQGRWGTTPVGFWARSLVPLVAGRPLLPVEQVVIVADAQSGMGVPLHPDSFSFVNPDLVVHLGREPAPGWLGFDIRSMSGGQGAGWAASELRDEVGLFGRSAQALVVRRRD